MKKLFITIGILAVLGLIFAAVRSEPREENAQDEEQAGETVTANEPSSEDAGDVTITPISHATMVLGWDNTSIYVDPLGGSMAFTDFSAPTIVLVTDTHGDHFNVSTLESVVRDETVLIVPQAVADELSPTLQTKAVVLANGEETVQEGMTITAMPMYNLPESDDQPHIKGKGNGYLLERNNVRVYIAGDTGDIPEMRALTDIDIAFVPMNLPFTMTVDSAADAVLEFAPARVYPYHYRGRDGLSDINRFKELVEAGNPDIEVILLDWYPEEPQASTAAAPATEAKTEVEEQDQQVADVEPTIKTFTVSGVNFAFDVKEIRVKKGDTVRIDFTSTDGFHDWVVDAFDARTEQVSTGESSSVTFVADEAGAFEYYCSVGNHRAQGMVGTLLVEE